jgi:hypothetical protein
MFAIPAMQRRLISCVTAFGVDNAKGAACKTAGSPFSTE